MIGPPAGSDPLRFTSSLPSADSGATDDSIIIIMTNHHIKILEYCKATCCTNSIYANYGSQVAITQLDII